VPKSPGPDKRKQIRHACGVPYRECLPCRSTAQKAWIAANPERWKAAKKKWADEHKDRIPAYSRRYLLKKQYGLTPSQAAEIFEDSDGLCAICYSVPAVHIDHDHQTGVIRGALCNPCNQGLGYFKDDPERLRLAADYLEVIVRQDVPAA
jgi:Recombination endonuclease VII